MSDEINEGSGPETEGSSMEMSDGHDENYEGEEEQEEGSEQFANSGAEVEQLKGEIEEAIEDGASEEEVKDMIREFELKINGKTVKKRIDLNNEDEVKRQLQLAAAGQSAMQSKAELEKAIRAEYDKLLGDPARFLQENGIDPRDFSEKYIEQLINESQKSPEQVEKEKYMKELEEARREADRLKQEKQDAEFQRMQEQAAVQLDEEISDALDSITSLPKSPYVVKRFADTLLWAMENGHPDVTAKDIAPIVENELTSEFNNLFDALPEEAFAKMIGKKNLDRLRKKRVAAATRKPKVQETARRQDSGDKKPKKPIKMKDFFRNL